MKWLTLIRELLGRIIILMSHLMRPKQIIRSDEEQKKIIRQTQGLSLYQFYACPFCLKVRREIYRLNLPIKIQDVQHDQANREELIQYGGKMMVPCLKIIEKDQTSWLYESKDIIQYLNQRFNRIIS